MGVLSSDICLGVGDKFERTLLAGLSDTLRSSFLRHPSLGGKRIQKNCWVVVPSHSQKFFFQVSVSGWETNPKELLDGGLSHSQVLPEQAGKWAQAVPVPHAQAVAGQPLDNGSLPVWIVPGSGWELALALTKEHLVLRQLWLNNRFLGSLGQLGNWLGLHQSTGHGQG